MSTQPDPNNAAPVRSYATALYLIALGVPLLGATIKDGHVLFLFPSRDVPAGLRAYHNAKAKLDEAEMMAHVVRPAHLVVKQRVLAEGGAR